jgi:hypothetical protein
MKKIFIAISLCVLLAASACHDRSNMHDMTSTPLADTPGSGAKMIDSPGKGRPDSVIGDNDNGTPRAIIMKKK